TLKSLKAQTLAYIEAMSGEQTGVVRKTKADLDVLKAEAQKTHSEIMGWVAEVNAASAGRSTRLVKAGATSSPEKVKEAFESAEIEYGNERKKIAANAQQKEEEAHDLYLQEKDAEGELDTKALRQAAYHAALKKHTEAIEAIEQGEHEALQNAEVGYRQEINELFQGLLEHVTRTNPELAQKLTEWYESLDLAQAIQGSKLGEKAKGAASGKGFTVSDDEKSLLKQALVGTDYENWDIDKLVGDMNSDPVLAAKVSQALTDTVDALNETVAEEFASSKTDMGTPGITLQMLIEQGLLGDTTIDTESIRGKLALMLGQLNLPELVKTALAESLAQDPPEPEPATVTPEVKADPAVDTTGAADKVKDETKKSVEGAASVKATLPVDVGLGSDTSDVSGEAQALVTAAESELKKGASGAKTAGANFGQGFADGMNSKMGTIVARAAALARAALNAVNSTVENASPSKATRRSGRFFSEGFALGIGDQIRATQLASRNLGSASLAALNVGKLHIAAQMASSASRMPMSEPIDYDRLADAIVRRPANLYANGRIMATTLADDNARAISARDRRIARGYGGR
ncbi:MAG: hypothetical protein RSB64_15255, partial [Pseudomonas sp.]